MVPYRSVTAMLPCPRLACRAASDPPASLHSVAKVCRHRCEWNRAIPESFRTVLLNLHESRKGDSCPTRPTKRASTGLYQQRAHRKLAMWHLRRAVYHKDAATASLPVRFPGGRASSTLSMRPQEASPDSPSMTLEMWGSAILRRMRSFT